MSPKRMRARGRRLQRRDGAHQRRLARAVGAEQAEHAARDRQGDIVERDRAIGISVRQIGDFEHVVPPIRWQARGSTGELQVGFRPVDKKLTGTLAQVAVSKLADLNYCHLSVAS